VSIDGRMVRLPHRGYTFERLRIWRCKMELKYVDASKMKTHEEYVSALLTGLISLRTLESFHIRAADIGILKEDQMCRAHTIIWDMRRMQKLYSDQAASILELLPDTFDVDVAIEVLRKTEIKKAKAMARAPKVKPCDT